MRKDGTADLTAVEETFRWIKTPAIVLKSTRSPHGHDFGAHERKYKLANRLVFSPEYIGEGGYPVPHWEGIPHPTDMKLHQTFIFGGERVAIEKVIPFFTRVRGPFAEYRSTDSTTAELAEVYGERLDRGEGDLLQ